MFPETSASKWIHCPRPVDHPKLRLICFPPAGSGAVIYHKWAADLPPAVEMWILRFPGRESRIRDPLITRLHTLIECVAATLPPHLDQTYLLFGHSLGSLISFELTRYLRNVGEPLPAHLLLSGHRAPHRPPRMPPINGADDKQFLARIRELGGIPDAVLENEEIVELMMPPFRADFGILENYRYRNERPLDIPISVFGSDGDCHVHEADILSWEQHTTGSFESHMFHGGHFYFHNDRGPLLNRINDCLQKYL